MPQVPRNGGAAGGAPVGNGRQLRGMETDSHFYG
jgi:hypothetical protein